MRLIRQPPDPCGHYSHVHSSTSYRHEVAIPSGLAATRFGLFPASIMPTLTSVHTFLCAVLRILLAGAWGNRLLNRKPYAMPQHPLRAGRSPDKRSAHSF
jgi:hypothetical protein